MSSLIRESPSSQPDSFRKLAAYMIERGEMEGIRLVYTHFEHEARVLLQLMSGEVALVEWQRLALDMEVALEDVDAELSACARRLAAEIRDAVTMIDRNPRDRVANRPTARKVLDAVAAYGGLSCPLSVVKEMSGLGQTHLSNILKPLAAHGFVTVTVDQGDGRERRVGLTVLGRANIAPVAHDAGSSTFQDHIDVRARRHENFRAMERTSSSNKGRRYVRCLRPTHRLFASHS